MKGSARDAALVSSSCAAQGLLAQQAAPPIAIRDEVGTEEPAKLIAIYVLEKGKTLARPAQ